MAVPVVLKMNLSQERMRFRKFSVQFKRLECGRAYLISRFADAQTTPDIVFNIRVSKSCVSLRVTGVDANGLLKVLNPFVQRGWVSLAGVIIAKQEGVVGVRVDGAGISQVLPLLRLQVNFDLPDDGLGHLTLLHHPIPQLA